MSKVIDHRYDFVFLFDVADGNPNGDPDAGNLPRVDPETGHGLVTDVCIKRKIRNYVANYATAVGDAEDGLNIYFTDGAVLNQKHAKAWEKEGPKDQKDRKKLPRDLKQAEAITRFMCNHFYDIRTFGAVMSTEVNCGQVRGPVQISFARSIDPIVSSEHAITRSSVTNEKDLEKERTMGRKFTVPYALYRAHGAVNPFLAEKTGFNDNDLTLFWKAMENAFEFDQSAARPAGSMSVRKLIVFRHDNKLGDAPAHRLLDMVTVKATSTPVRSFGQYEIVVPDKGTMPKGVTLEVKV